MEPKIGLRRWFLLAIYRRPEAAPQPGNIPKLFPVDLSMREGEEEDLNSGLDAGGLTGIHGGGGGGGDFSFGGSATARTVGHLSKSVEVMKLVSNLMKAPEVATTMQEFSKEMTNVSLENVPPLIGKKCNSKSAAYRIQNSWALTSNHSGFKRTFPRLQVSHGNVQPLVGKIISRATTFVFSRKPRSAPFLLKNSQEGRCVQNTDSARILKRSERHPFIFLLKQFSPNRNQKFLHPYSPS
ncbi:hypothetical protein KSP39_PZI017778 [Platanthera zijinensis]|uniref:Uncharacterized protein n=1 Tax=Platanthera zijinensis TaxID=2320716 RepID=A0AAP0FZV2_9ASPA